MSRLESAQPGRDGVLVYKTTAERDAAAEKLPHLRKEIEFAPAGELWLAWRWPVEFDNPLESGEGAFTVRLRQANAVSKKYGRQLAAAMLNPHARQVLATGSFATCQGVFYSMRDRLEHQPFVVEFDALMDENTVYVTYTGEA